MQFRLFYEGRFLAANESADPVADKRVGHKHHIRRCFHRQLQDLWATNRYLREVTLDTGPNAFFPNAFTGQEPGSFPMVEVLADVHSRFGFRFVPLVCEEFKLNCHLEILVLRRDRPGNIFKARDIDNRLKILFDALKVPATKAEIGDAQPDVGEDPFYVLLQSDDLITHVSVETDDLLNSPPAAGKDDSFARVLINVTIRPYVQMVRTSGFN